MKQNQGMPCGDGALPLYREEGRDVAADAQMVNADVTIAIAKYQECFVRDRNKSIAIARLLS